MRADIDRIAIRIASAGGTAQVLEQEILKLMRQTADAMKLDGGLKPAPLASIALVAKKAIAESGAASWDELQATESEAVRRARQSAEFREMWKLNEAAGRYNPSARPGYDDEKGLEVWEAEQKAKMFFPEEWSDLLLR